MGFARKDVEATKKMEKKFVRYPEGAEKYSLGLTKFQALAKEAKQSIKLIKQLQLTVRYLKNIWKHSESIKILREKIREKEAKLMKDQLDGLDLYVAGKASVNDTFDRYMSTKYNLRESTKSSYLYTYDHYVRDTFGKKRIAEIKYSDVLQLYYYLLNETKISLGTLDTVHCLLHPTFQLAVRDEIIRNYDLCIWYSDCGIYKLADKCIAWLRYVFKTDTWSCDWKLMYCRLWWTDQ